MASIVPPPGSPSIEQAEKFCNHLRKLDREYSTPKNSPLHHDNRMCPVHNPVFKPTEGVIHYREKPKP